MSRRRAADEHREAVRGDRLEAVLADLEVPARGVATERPPDAPRAEAADRDPGPLAVVEHRRVDPRMADVRRTVRRCRVARRRPGWRPVRGLPAARRSRHFSTPVTTTPRMNARWARKKTTTGTTIVSRADGLDQGRLRHVQRVVLLDGDRTAAAARACPQVQQRQEEVVPGEEEVEQADRRDRRDRQRQDDRAQDPERARRRRSSPPRRARAGST